MLREAGHKNSSYYYQQLRDITNLCKQMLKFVFKNNSVVLTLAKAIKEFLYHCPKKQKELLVNQLNMLSFCSARGISGTQEGGGGGGGGYAVKFHTRWLSPEVQPAILYSPLYGTLLFSPALPPPPPAFVYASKTKQRASETEFVFILHCSVQFFVVCQGYTHAFELALRDLGQSSKDNL